MTLARWDPFRDLVALQDRMNRLFDESVRNVRTGDEALSSATWSPAVDIYETANEVVVKAELPEVNQSDIDIQVENNTLTLRGERKFDKETKQENFHRIERAYGVFSRSFTLPSTVDQERIKADYKDGILRISLPKREASKPKQIKVAIS
ncbi:MAG: molecular chaperone [Acidobacteria bacterium]|nr:MAG: molecular chaperone [Acidobacteriota bacterium]